MPGVIWVSFIMDKPLAPACKVYHAHCKEVKDWVVFAGNVATTPGLSISVCYCCESGMQGRGQLHYRSGGLGVLVHRQAEVTQLKVDELARCILTI